MDAGRSEEMRVGIVATLWNQVRSLERVGWGNSSPKPNAINANTGNKRRSDETVPSKMPRNVSVCRNYAVRNHRCEHEQDEHDVQNHSGDNETSWRGGVTNLNDTTGPQPVDRAPTRARPGVSER